MFKQLRKKNNIRRNTTRVYIFRNRKQRFFLVNCTNSRSSRKEGTMGTCLICGTDSAALISLRTSWTVEMINARCRDELTPRRSAAKLFAKASRCSCIFNKLDPVSSQDPREASSRHFSLSLSLLFLEPKERENREPCNSFHRARILKETGTRRTLAQLSFLPFETGPTRRKIGRLIVADYNGLKANGW